MSRNDGKYLEDEIEKQLKKNTDLGIHWIRLPDARAARGRVAAQPADYFLCNRGSAIYLEAKSQKGKIPRLKRFSQESAMRRWGSAGVRGLLIVHFHELGRLFLVDVKNLESGKPSWVLKDNNSREVFDVKEAINYMLGR